MVTVSAGKPLEMRAGVCGTLVEVGRKGRERMSEIWQCPYNEEVLKWCWYCCWYAMQGYIVSLRRRKNAPFLLLLAGILAYVEEFHERRERRSL